VDYDIRSPGNDRIKRLARLRQQAHRDAERVFPVEEIRVFGRALESGHHPAEIYWCPDLADEPVVAGVPAISISPEALERASYRSNPEGLIALFPYFDLDLDVIEPGRDPLILIAEGIEKPGNLGAMLRVADAAGLNGMVVVDSKVDPFNPNVVRASTGALFVVPMAQAAPGDVVDWLSGNGIRSVATVVAAGDPLWQVDLQGPLAIWVGSEAEGLTAAMVDEADQLVTIPTMGRVDSLNASVSAAIVVFEAIRQRLGAASE
jgi:RNA methyltransferase, TrmH family